MSDAGAYRVCVTETWQPNMLIFAFLNLLTTAIIIYLQRKGNYALADRLINILFLFNVFAFTMTFVVALGLKFLPV